MMHLICHSRLKKPLIPQAAMDSVRSWVRYTARSRKEEQAPHRPWWVMP